MSGEHAATRVRQAQAEDMSALLEVARGCDGAPHWSESVWAEVLHGTTLERAVFVTEVVADDVGIEGFVVVAQVADVAEIESIAVAMGSRRKGVARALSNAAIKWAKQRGAAGMELEVRAGNEAALRLYAGLGFAEQCRRARYYRGPVEDAVLMRLLL